MENYELFPLNFVMLPENKQVALIENFQRFLNSLTSEIKIIVQFETREVLGTPMNYYRFYIQSQEAIDDLLSAFSLPYIRVTEVPTQEVVKVFPQKLALKGGRLVKSATIYSLPSNLVEGFISETYGVIDKAIIRIVPLEQDRAVAKMELYARLLGGMIIERQTKNLTPPIELVQKNDTANETLNALIAGATRLFRVSITFSVGGNTDAELQRRFKQLKSILNARLIKIDSPSYYQYPLWEGEGKWLYMDTSTASTLFPFVSADVIELPSGLFLGINLNTGAPVIYDPMLRPNYNVAVIGASGAGKSYTGKIILSRYLAKDPDASFFIIDPENEYIHLPIPITQKINYKPGTELGFDPLAIFNKLDAIEIIKQVTHIPPELDGELKAGVQKARTLKELYSNAPESLKSYLKSMVEGPESFIFSGTPAEFADRIIFGFRELENEMLKEIVSLIVFGKVWKVINELPVQRQKLLIIDEAWLYMGIPIAAKFLDTVSRMGRKRNVMFLILTQRPEDILQGVGRGILENSATKIIMKQNEIAAPLVKEAFGLSETEEEMVQNFEPGDAILISENVHVSLHFYATEEEDKLFTTKPSEIETSLFSTDSEPESQTDNEGNRNDDKNQRLSIE